MSWFSGHQLGRNPKVGEKRERWFLTENWLWLNADRILSISTYCRLLISWFHVGLWTVDLSIFYCCSQFNNFLLPLKIMFFPPLGPETDLPWPPLHFANGICLMALPLSPCHLHKSSLGVQPKPWLLQATIPSYSSPLICSPFFIGWIAHTFEDLIIYLQYHFLMISINGSLLAGEHGLPWWLKW